LFEEFNFNVDINNSPFRVFEECSQVMPAYSCPSELAVVLRGKTMKT
jgi:hypothetical protein